MTATTWLREWDRECRESERREHAARVETLHSRLSDANEWIGRIEEENRQLRKKLAEAERELEWRRGRR